MSLSLLNFAEIYAISNLYCINTPTILYGQVISTNMHYVTLFPRYYLCWSIRILLPSGSVNVIWAGPLVLVSAEEVNSIPHLIKCS